MKRERFNARLLGVVAIGLALACGSGARIAAPSTSRAGEFSASVAAPTTAARIGWERRDADDQVPDLERATGSLRGGDRVQGLRGLLEPCDVPEPVPRS